VSAYAPARCSRFALALALCGLASTLRAQGVPQGPPAPAPQTRPQARIVRSIEVQGAHAYTKEQILSALGQEVGKPYDDAAEQRGLKALWESFRVRADALKVRPTADGGVDLLLIVTEEPFDREPRFAGNREVDLETLRRWARLDEKSEVYLYEGDRVRQRLLEGYHQEGYPFVEIDVHKRGETAASGEVPDIIFEIREGPQVHVKGIQITGNRSLPETGALWWKNGLEHLAKTELGGPWLFSPSGSKFVEETLQSDLLALREVYRDLGWLDAVVELDPPLEFSPDRSGVIIHIRVDEGEPYIVSKFSIRGVTRTLPPNARDWSEATETDVPLLLDEKDLRALCKIQPGKRYERAREKLDAGALRKFYGKHGYLSHSSLDPADSFTFLDPELVFDSKNHTVEVTYKLQQGHQIWIHEVLFSGSEFTRDRVLRREVDVLPGQPADVDEILRSLERIHGTNYFNDESRPLEHHDPTYHFQKTKDANKYDLVYDLEEGRVVEFNINAGVDSNNGLVGHLNLSMRNFDISNTPSTPWSVFSEIYDKQAFHGAGQTLQLDIAPGTVTNQARIRFIEPDLFGTQFNRYGLDVELATTRREWDFYTEERERTTVRISRDFGRNFVLSAGVTAQLIDISNLEAPLSGINQPDAETLPPGIREEEGKSALNGWLFDAKYSRLDSRINPYQGFAANWRNALYGGALGGNWDFVRSQLDLDAFFLPVERQEEKVQAGFHASLGLGVSNPMGDTVDVPYTERFFLGGLNNLRGFRNRGVGPNIGGEPIGGETMINGTIEYRIPISTQVQPGTYKEVEVFRALFFADAGMLDPEPFHLDFSELRTSVGFGVGMAYPLPINLYFGFPVRDGEGDRRQTFGFSIAAFGF
jgi:outer membrane protein insertion porin family